jgi:uncharacterized repeat protein (TIGR03803 family)
MKSVSVALFAGFVACAFVQLVSAAGAATYNETVLYSFCSKLSCTDGANPQEGDSLVDVKGTLYGTTGLGGSRGHGTVFAVNATTGKEKVVHSFCSQTQGSYCLDGSQPRAGLIDVNGTLYGTTEFGGDAGCDGSGCGTVFSLDPRTGTETVLYSFGGGADGATPFVGVIDVNGTLYGTTYNGGGTGCGDSGCGTVFSLDLSTGTEAVLHSFGGMDGAQPFASLIEVNGILYGTTRAGGFYNAGAVFSIDPNTGAENVLYSFCSQFSCPDGTDPEADLLDVNGMLYGTTVSGGKNCAANTPPGCGTVFALDPKTGAETVVHSFSGTDGQNPQAGLIAVRGTLFGTTHFGGDSGSGTAYSINPTTGAEKVLHSFGGGADGRDPEASLIAVKGTFYGTTISGGTSSDGTVFALKSAH